jgi:hypothetical protein
MKKILFFILIPTLLFSQSQGGAGSANDWTFPGSINVVGSESSHGEMDITTGGAYTINTTNVWHGYTGFSSGHLTTKITFNAGKTASDITVYATYDAGATTKVTATAAHGLVAGNVITITGTTNYNDVYEVQESVDANNFTIDKAWDTNDDGTGTYALPSCFIIGTDGAGDYLINWTAGGSAIAADTFEFGIYHEKTLDHKNPRKFPNNDVGAWAGCGIIAVADTDVIWFAVRNTTGTNNIDIDEIQFVIHKL